MAGFLRRKTKQSQQQPDVPLKDVNFDNSPSTAPSTPLFARFATTANNSNKDGITPRMVSGPMQLSTRKDRDPAASAHRSGSSGKGGSGYGHSTTSLTAGSRDAELAARSRRMQAQIQERGFGAGAGFDNKPLPPPVDKPSTTTTAHKFGNATRGPGPPPTLQNQYHQNQNGRSRLSLDGRELENKPLPLPHPGPSQYQHQGTTYPSEMSARRRNGSVAANTNAAPPPTISPTASYGQGYGLRMPDDGNNIGNGNGILPADGANANRMSLAPAPRLEGLGTATPMSDRAIDLPPEVALFQVSSVQFIEFSSPFFFLPFFSFEISRAPELGFLFSAVLCSAIPCFSLSGFFLPYFVYTLLYTDLSSPSPFGLAQDEIKVEAQLLVGHRRVNGWMGMG